MLNRQLASPGGALADPALRDELHTADLVFGNLEVPLTDRGHAADKAVCFRSSPALASTLAPKWDSMSCRSPIITCLISGRKGYSRQSSQCGVPV